jgi:siroheme synthase
VTAPVLLVGGGPGDPALLTLKAEQLLRGAATVVTDLALLDLARAGAPDAEIVVAPDDPRDLVALVGQARPAVVRLYRGDPWLHPAHGPELAALTAAGVATEPVPGISVEIGTRTAAGDPLHHRRRSVVAVLPMGSECAEPRETVAQRIQNPERSVVARG